VQNKILTAQRRKGYCWMCKLSKIWPHQKLLLSQMCRWPLGKPTPPKRKI
jgi:hypothetical protein